MRRDALFTNHYPPTTIHREQPEGANLGKATILSGGTAGQYSVQVNLDRVKLTAQIARMTANIATLEGQITATQTLITSKEAEIAVLNASIAFYANKPAYLSELKTASQSLAQKTNELAALNQTKNLYTLQKKSLELRLSWLQNQVSSDPTVSAWCADRTEDLFGDVGTIEVPGDRKSVV